MKICLSGRILEYGQQRLDLDSFITMAKQAGYDGISLRPWQAPVNSSEVEIDRLRDRLHEEGVIVCSMLVSENIEAAAAIARRLGVKVLQNGKPLAVLHQNAQFLDADMRIGPQMHSGSIFESIADSADQLSKTQDPRIGVIVEPGNLMFSGTRWALDAFEPLRGRIIGCNLQSIEVGQGEQCVKMKDGSSVYYQRVLLNHNRQINLAGFIAALRAVGYDDFINVIEPGRADVAREELASVTARYLKEIIRGR